MPNYLLNKIVNGTIITFRYNNPNHVGIKNVIVLNTGFEGNLHGLKVEQLTPTEQEYLQMIFQTMYTSPQDFFNPLIANIEQRKKELEILAKQRADLLQKGQAVVMKPQPQGMFGSITEKGRQVFGSVIGKVKTFGRTQTQAIPAAQMNKQIQEEIQKTELLTQQKKQEFDQYSKYVKEQQEIWRKIGSVPTHPYQFYHQVVKPMFGRIRLPDIYRKYKVDYIKTPRVIKSPGGIIYSK